MALRVVMILLGLMFGVIGGLLTYLLALYLGPPLTIGILVGLCIFGKVTSLL